MDYGATFGKAVRDVAVCGFLKDSEEIAPGVFVAQETAGWRAVAIELAERLPGMTVQTKGGGGVSWVCGRVKGKAEPPQGVIIALGKPWLRVQDSRALLNRVGLLKGAIAEGRPIWSVGSAARCFLRSIGAKQDYSPTAERIIEGYPWGYHCCKPGKYKAKPTGRMIQEGRDLILEEEPGILMYDASAYYFNLLRRLESPIVEWRAPGKVKITKLSPNQRERFGEMLVAVEDLKTLRNSIVGCMAGSLKPGTAYTSAEPKKRKGETVPRVVSRETYVTERVRIIHPPGSPGMFRAAGLLIVRSGTEITHEEAIESKAVYSCVDSIATTESAYTPKVWSRYGLPWERHGSGNAEFCHRGSYRIGPRQTVPYFMGWVEYNEVTVSPLPSKLYRECWL